MSFLYPGFLLALSAVLIPILIHLFELRKAKKVMFTNVRFLKQVKHVTASHRKLRHLLILLSRILFISFLVLTFAQPFLPAGDESAKPASEVRFYLDNSMSMQNETEPNGLSLLEKSIEEIKKIANLFPASTQFMLVDNDLKPTSFIKLSKDKLEDLLNNIDYSAKNISMSAVASRFSLEKGSNEKTKVFLFSDFQKSTFNTKDFELFNNKTQLSFVQTSPYSVKNVFVDSVFLQDEFVRVNADNKLVVRFYNNGTEAVEDCNVKFFINDLQAAAFNITIDAKSHKEETLNFRLQDHDLKSCKIVLEDFPVQFDNTYYFTLRAAQRINILELVESGKSTTFQKLYASEPLFAFSSSVISTLNYGALKSSDLLILNGVSNIDAATSDNIRKFVAEGGSMIIIPSDNPNKQDYLNLIGSLGIRNFTINEQLKQEDLIDLRAPNFKDPFYRSIFTDADPRIQMPRALPLLSWSRSEGDLLKFKTGENFLSHFSSGSGKIFLFSTPFSSNYTDFQNHALFVPVMYKMAMRSYKLENKMAYSFSDKTISIKMPEIDFKKGVFSLIKDSLEFIPEQQVRGNSLIFSIPADVAAAGFYSLSHPDGHKSTLAFNYSKEESYLDVFNPKEISSELDDLSAEARFFNIEKEASVADEIKSQLFGKPLWKYCLLLALIFLFAEVLLIRFTK